MCIYIYIYIFFFFFAGVGPQTVIEHRDDYDDHDRQQAIRKPPFERHQETRRTLPDHEARPKDTTAQMLPSGPTCCPQVPAKKSQSQNAARKCRQDSARILGAFA